MIIVVDPPTGGPVRFTISPEHGLRIIDGQLSVELRDLLDRGIYKGVPLFSSDHNSSGHRIVARVALPSDPLFSIALVDFIRSHQLTAWTEQEGDLDRLQREIDAVVHDPVVKDQLITRSRSLRPLEKDALRRVLRA